MASVAGRCPASGVHPSGIVVRVSGGPAVRCPARPVSGHLGSSPGVRRSGRLLSTRPVSGPLVSTRPASSRLVSAPSVRTRPSPPIPAGGVGPRSVRRAPVTTGTGRVPVGCRAVERFGRRPSRPGRGRCCRARVLVSGASVADPGRVGYGGGACPLSDQAGLAGVRSARGWRRRQGAGAGCGARWPHLPRGCRRGLGGDHGGW
jgi:hypothetical protein